MIVATFALILSGMFFYIQSRANVVEDADTSQPGTLAATPGDRT